MSDATPDPARPPATPFDRQEVRRLIALSFSIGELSRFAEGFGVMLDRVGSTDDAARQLVKLVEKRGEARRLLLRLQETKPLVVWPEPPPEPKQESADEPDHAGQDEDDREGAAGPTVFQGPALQTPEQAPAPKPAPAEPQPVVDPYLASIPAEPDDEGPPAWRMPLIVGSALLLGLSAGVGVTWWQLSKDDAAPAPVTPEATVSQLAADMLDGAVEKIAEQCDVKPDDGESARNVLAASFQNCRKLDVRPPRGSNITPPPPQSTPRPTTASGSRRPAAQPNRSPSSAACIERCHSAYVQCQKSQCGEEPRSAKAYPEWQRCKGRCLQAYGPCRRGCQ